MSLMSTVFRLYLRSRLFAPSVTTSLFTFISRSTLATKSTANSLSKTMKPTSLSRSSLRSFLQRPGTSPIMVSFRKIVNFYYAMILDEIFEISSRSLPVFNHGCVNGEVKNNILYYVIYTLLHKANYSYYRIVSIFFLIIKIIH